jgi:hypothetical protein
VPVVALEDDSHRRRIGQAGAPRVEKRTNDGTDRPVRVVEPAQTADAGRRRLWTFFSHPLLLLVLGAAFTAGVTNRITHQWQKRDRQVEIRTDLHQKELQVKADLARNIGEATGAILAAMHSIELTEHGKPGRAYDRAYEDWLVNSNGIDSQIRVYFRWSKVSDDWDTYVANMRAMHYFFKFEGRAYEPRRLKLLRDINLYFEDSGLGEEELKEIARFRYPPGGINIYLDLYFRRLLDDFRERANDLITMILDARSVLTVDSPERRPPAVGNVAAARGVRDRDA